MSIVAITNEKFSRFHTASSAKAETNDRVLAVHDALTRLGVELLEAPRMNLDDVRILGVHSAEHIRNLNDTESRASILGIPVDAGQSARMAPGTLTAVETMMAGSIRGAQLLIEGNSNIVYVVGRSPGHHADDIRLICDREPEFKTPGPMGFCLMANAAAAARWLESYGWRVGVIDIDVHMGNGTQHALAHVATDREPNIYMVDLFTTKARYAYPRIEAPDGDPERYTMAGFAQRASNIQRFPLDSVSWTNYKPALEKGLDWLKKKNVDATVVSFGVDTMQGDPIGGGKLSPAHMREILKGIASVSTRNRSLFIMEGGYRLENLGEGARALVETARA